MTTERFAKLLRKSLIYKVNIDKFSTLKIRIFVNPRHQKQNEKAIHKLLEIFTTHKLDKGLI